MTLPSSSYKHFRCWLLDVGSKDTKDRSPKHPQESWMMREYLIKQKILPEHIDV